MGNKVGVPAGKQKLPGW